MLTLGKAGFGSAQRHPAAPTSLHLARRGDVHQRPLALHTRKAKVNALSPSCALESQRRLVDAAVMEPEHGIDHTFHFHEGDLRVILRHLHGVGENRMVGQRLVEEGVGQGLAKGARVAQRAVRGLPRWRLLKRCRCSGDLRLEQALEAVDILVAQGVTVELEQIVDGLRLGLRGWCGGWRLQRAIAAGLTAHSTQAQSDKDEQ
jgi:hypothetical protein